MSKAVVHKLVAITAIEMAAALYEECAKDDAWYAVHRSQSKFVQTQWPKLIVQARETLGGMLAEGSSATEHMKAEIYEALIADSSLPNVGLSPQIKLN